MTTPVPSLRRVLLIDDYEPIKQELADLLEEWGFEVMAGKPKNVLQQVIPDLVICSHHPPNCNCLSILQELRLNSSNKYIPFILTSTNHHHDRSNKYEFQPDAFLPKPFSAQKLLHHINQLCTPTCP